jgi:hypothetical protein
MGLRVGGFAFFRATNEDRAERIRRLSPLAGKLRWPTYFVIGGAQRYSPDESGVVVTPRDWKLHHIDAPQRMWPYLPVPSTARVAGVPRDPPATVYRVRWGDPLRPGSSGLYVHSIRTLAACQPPL